MVGVPGCMSRAQRLQRCYATSRRRRHYSAATSSSCVSDGTAIRSNSSNVLSSANVTDESIPPLESFSLFASCLPGLEPILYKELVDLGLEPEAPPATRSSRKQRWKAESSRDKDKDTAESSSLQAQVHSGAGGIGFTVRSVESILRCHLYLGTATHILLRCSQPFKARGMEELRRKVSKMLFWKQYLRGANSNTGPKAPNLDIRVTASKSRLYHTAGIAERVEQGVLGALGVDPNESTSIHTIDDSEERKHQYPSVKLLVRVKNDYVQISVDTSDTPLHRRGYRLQGAKSPLREDLAYGLLFGSGWRRHNYANNDEMLRFTHLLDPCCGSGTLPIEGAAIAAGVPPGRLRSEPMSGSFLADELLWKRLISDAESNLKDVGSTVCVFGSDRDRGAIAASNANAERAGVSDLITFKRCAITACPWLSGRHGVDAATDGKLLIVSNPPFGKRSSANKDVYPLYRALAERYSSLDRGASLSVLAQNIDAVRKATAGLHPHVLFSSRHGGLSVVAMHCVK